MLGVKVVYRVETHATAEWDRRGHANVGDVVATLWRDSDSASRVGKEPALEGGGGGRRSRRGSCNGSRREGCNGSGGRREGCNSIELSSERSQSATQAIEKREFE